MTQHTDPLSNDKLPHNPVGLAIRQDTGALEALFRQFIDNDEPILVARYFGLKGIWHIGYHSFGCLTDKRVCALQIGWLGHVSYTDAFLEDCNALQVDQPSLLLLYLASGLFVISTLGFGVLVLPAIVRLYYRLVKSGLSTYIRSGGRVFIFCNRREIRSLNRLVRRLVQERDRRLIDVFGVGHDKLSPA